MLHGIDVGRRVKGGKVVFSLLLLLIYLVHHAGWIECCSTDGGDGEDRRLRYFYNRQVVYLRLQKDALQATLYFTFLLYVFLSVL
jgi:hypothetical protein